MSLWLPLPRSEDEGSTVAFRRVERGSWDAVGGKELTKLERKRPSIIVNCRCTLDKRETPFGASVFFYFSTNYLDYIITTYQ